MQRVKLIFVVLPLIIAVSCSESTAPVFRFDQEINLTGKTVPVTDAVHLRYPFRIRQGNSLLYILDIHSPDLYCHTFSYPQMALVNSFALKGNGPEEFLRVENIRLDQKGKIYLLDANKNAVSIYNSSGDSLCKRINLSEKLIRCLDFALINDSLFAIPDYSGKFRVNIVDFNGDIVRQLFTTPTKKRNEPAISDIVLAQAWRSFIDYNPENGVLAMATQLGQVIEIYNLNTEETINIVYGTYGEPEFATQDAYAVPNGIMGYSNIHVAKDKIYALFWGTSFKDIRKSPMNRTEGGNMIHVFNLKGEPIIQYTLDRHITGFRINEQKNILLGLDINNDQPIVEYQLKDL